MMLIKSLSINSVSKFSTVCVLAVTVVFGSANLACAGSRDRREQVVTAYTNLFFYKANPQFENRRLQSTDIAPGDRSYWRDWGKIREAVEQEIQYSDSIICGTSTTRNWRLREYDDQPSGKYVSRSLDRVANVIFNQRRALLGDQITRSEWVKIRHQISINDSTSCSIN